MLDILIHIFFLVIEILICRILWIVPQLLKSFYQERGYTEQKESRKVKKDTVQRDDSDGASAKTETPLPHTVDSMEQTPPSRADIDVPSPETSFVPEEGLSVRKEPPPVQKEEVPAEASDQPVHSDRGGGASPDKTDQLLVKQMIRCSLRDLNSVNTYGERVYLAENPSGELLVMIYQNGLIKGSPSQDYANERTLNDLFSVCFEFDIPRWPKAKKFSICCTKEAILERDDEGFWVQEKGRLKVAAY